MDRTSSPDMPSRMIASRVGADIVRSRMLGASLPNVDGRYEVQALLGYGVSGAVVRAHDGTLHRHVALKLAPLSAATDSMQHEARTLAQMKRPRHVVQVMEVGNGVLHDSAGESEVAFVCMELAEGEALRTWLASEKQPLRDMIAVFRDVADGLANAHAHGILHGDIKPDNVIVTTDRTPMLVDFGFAAVLSSGQDEVFRREVVGTGPYLAPELIEGQAARASDVYALAVTIWEALTGEYPFGESGKPKLRFWGGLGALRMEKRVPRPLRRMLRRALHPWIWVRPTATGMRARLETFRKTLVGTFGRWLRRLRNVAIVFVLLTMCFAWWFVPLVWKEMSRKERKELIEAISGAR